MSAYNIGFYRNSLLFHYSFCHLAHTVQNECEMKYFEALIRSTFYAEYLRQAKQKHKRKARRGRARQPHKFKEAKELKHTHTRQGADEMSSPDKLGSLRS